MGGWGSERRAAKSRDECKEFVKRFCQTEEADVKTVEFYDKNFSSISEAEEFVKGREEKLGPAVAASYYGISQTLKNTPSKKKLDQMKIELIPAKEKEIQTQINKLASLRNESETEFIKCENCESKINSKYLVGFRITEIHGEEIPTYSCPACKKNGLLPKFLKIEYKKFGKLVQELKTLSSKLLEIDKKVAAENERQTYWFVSVSIPT
jgi:hypothetical protein